MLHFELLHSTEHKEYRTALALYRQSFPPHEQRESHSQSEILSHPDYHFYLIYEDTCFVGLLLCWETDPFLYVEHFCILPTLRGQRYGSRALKQLASRGKPVILEIDPPIDDISIKRKCFYEQAGFHVNSFEHIHPPYHTGNAGHLLTVMSYPTALTSSEYTAFFDYLNTIVMRDVY